MAIFRNIKIIILFLFLFSSCLKKYNNIDFETDTQLIVPVAFGSFVLGDLLKNFNEDSILQTGDNGELFFSFKEDKVSKFYLNDLIKFPETVNLASDIKNFDNLSLNDTVYQQSILLKEFIDRLSFYGDILIFEDGKKYLFPEVIIGRDASAFMTWEIGDFNFIREAKFVDGVIRCSLTNNFPVSGIIEIEISDAEGKVLDTFLFKGNSGNGLQTGESEMVSTNLAGKSIKAPLYFKITNLHFFESPAPVIIDLDKGFDIKVELQKIKFSEVIINSVNFKYQSPVQQANIELADSIHLKKVKIETANLITQVKKQFQPPVILTVHFLNLYKEGNPFSFSISLNDNSFVANNFNLDGSELILTSSFAEFNSLEYYFELESTDNQFVELKSTDNIEYSISLQNLKFSYIEGDFGNRRIELNMNDISLNSEIWDKFQGKIFGNDPVLTLFISNPIGIPIMSDISINATNREGVSAAISRPSFLIPFPHNIKESPTLSELVFDNHNSNISNFIQLPPNGLINFSASLELNPNGTPTSDNLNFVNLNEPFIIGLGFKVPIMVEGVFFTFIDTLNFSTVKILSKLKRAELIFRTINGIPLQVNLSVTPFDTISNSVIGNELFVRLLEAAKTDETGNVVAATEAENSLVIEGEDLVSLRNSNSLLIKASILSPENGTKPAKLKNSYGFDLKIILDVTTDL